jgi:acyl-CoA thioester hydrolase
MRLEKAKRDFSRFTIRHEIKKNPETVSAILTVDIAWINALSRKLAVLPDEDIALLANGPLTPDFTWLE